MPDKKKSEPLTGDAAFQAAKREVAQRNEAAYAKGREQRDVKEAAAKKRRLDAEKRDVAERPKQP